MKILRLFFNIFLSIFKAILPPITVPCFPSNLLTLFIKLQANIANAFFILSPIDILPQNAITVYN